MILLNKKDIKAVFVIFLCSISFVLHGQEDTTRIDKASFSIYPALSYAPETGIGYGAIGFYVTKGKANEVRDEFYRPTSISPYVVYTTKKQILSALDIDMYLNNGINLNGKIRYFDFPDFFYGTGNDTDVDIKEQYTDQFFRINGRAVKPIGTNTFVGILYDLQYNNIKKVQSQGMLETASPKGITGGRNFGIGPGLLLDSRNSTLYPTRGSFLNMAITAFNEVIGSEYNYVSYLLDYRKYFEFLGPKNIVAFQFRMNMTSGTDIPFYKLPKLGGDERIRGIEHKNLYQDRQSVYFQVEGRQELFWRFGGVIFAGMGEVFNDFNDFSSNDLIWIYGLGGRFRALKDEKLNIRMDLGFTTNGQSAVYLSVREAF